MLEVELKVKVPSLEPVRKQLLEKRSRMFGQDTRARYLL